MQEWWESLAGATQFFYGMAAFFSVFFLWQIIAAFMGLDGDEMDADGSFDVSDNLNADDVLESSQAFKVLSLRSIITFFTLFSWGSALYTAEGMSVVKAMGIASVWGLIGMFAIALIFYGMSKLAETGTKDICSCKGKIGTVYLDIPAGGLGEIKISLTNAVEHVKARSVEKERLSAGTQVRVVEVMDQTMVKVEKLKEMEK